MSTLNNHEDTNCVICMGAPSISPRIMLECNHGYHKQCILQWLYENSTCPLCRRNCDPEKIQRYSFIEINLNDVGKSNSLDAMINLGLMTYIYVQKDTIARWSSRNKYSNMLLNGMHNDDQKDNPDYMKMYALNMMNYELFTYDFEKLPQDEQEIFHTLLLHSLETVDKLYKVELTGSGVDNNLLERIRDVLIMRHENKENTEFVGPEILSVGSNDIDDYGIMLLFHYINKNYNDLKAIKATGLFNTISYDVYKLCGETVEFNTFLLKLAISPFDNSRIYDNKTYQTKIDKYLRRNYNVFRNFNVQKYEKKEEIKPPPVVINAKYTAPQKLHQPGKLKNLSIWNETKEDPHYISKTVNSNPGKLKNISIWEKNNDIDPKHNTVKHKKSKSEMTLIWEQKQKNLTQYQSTSLQSNIPKRKRMSFEPNNELNTFSITKKQEIDAIKSIVSSKNTEDETVKYEIWNKYLDKYGEEPTELQLVTFAKSDDNIRSINFFEAKKIIKQYKSK